MGILDFFKRSDNRTDQIGKKPGEVTSKEVSKWAGKAGDKRAQNYDRQEALQNLAELAGQDDGGDERKKETRTQAVAALLRRFTFTMDPSITDADEKQIAFDGVLSAGKLALEPVRKFAAKAESLAWPMRIMKKLLDEEAYIDELLSWLSKWDTEYAKFIDPKIQLLAELEELKSPKIRAAVQQFLLDVNETARFHAVGATLAQDDPAAIQPLIEMFIEEESVRVRTRLIDGFISRGWAVPEDLRADARKSLPSGYTIDGEGLFRKKA
jgi:hypothetical protein